MNKLRKEISRLTNSTSFLQTIPASLPLFPFQEIPNTLSIFGSQIIKTPELKKGTFNILGQGAKL